VVRIAPRYEHRLVELVGRLDDRSVPIAEVVRRIAAAADERGLTRPSYVHMRRLIQRERLRQDEFRAIRDDAVSAVMSYRVPDLVDLTLRLQDASSR
jgi:hypothetical protein